MNRVSSYLRSAFTQQARVRVVDSEMNFTVVFSTSDSLSDVLLLSKVRDLENFGSGSGEDPPCDVS